MFNDFFNTGQHEGHLMHKNTEMNNGSVTVSQLHWKSNWDTNTKSPLCWTKLCKLFLVLVDPDQLGKGD